MVQWTGFSYTLFSNQEKSLQACHGHASLMELIAQWRFPPPRYVKMNHYMHVHVRSILKTKHNKAISSKCETSKSLCVLKAANWGQGDNSV